MALSDFELHPDRLATSDERGRRVFLYPADVKGFYRKQRVRLQAVLIVFFLALPWFRIHGCQALLLDISQQRFEIFGLSLRAHNAPILFFVFAAMAFGLFFVTAAYGRVWCGWACPQTVFIDGVFRRIERWVEGSALERRKLHSGPLTFRGFRLRLIKWTLYIFATLVITHSFLAYFVGTDQLANMMRHSPLENWGSFLFMAISSATILFDFAWFREQFCTVLCPYGRFQSVLMDRQSLVVTYDKTRGEPRATPQAKALSKAHGSQLGDCVNCYRCVQVCPTGIDIRRGMQMECIACTSCIDACDDVMTKLKKPTGLIRNDSLLPRASKKARLNYRAGFYLLLFVGAITALVFALALIKPVDIELLRAKDIPYTTQMLPEGTVMVVNHFKLELSNESESEHKLMFSLLRKAEDPQGGEIVDPELQLITAAQPLPIAVGKVTQTDIFIRFRKALLVNGQKRIRLVTQDTNTKTGQMINIEKEVNLVGPFQ